MVELFKIKTIELSFLIGLMDYSSGLNDLVLSRDAKGLFQMNVKPTYKELEQRVKDLEKENTRFRQVEYELNKSGERFRILQNASFSGIAIHEKGTIIDCNQGLSDISGYSIEELIGMNGFEFFAPDWHQVLMQPLLAGSEQSCDIEGIRKDGKKRLLNIHGKNITFQGRILRVTEIRDITQTKRLQSQLIQAQKMEAVGTLAGGIAHDFNNILSAIIGYTEMSLMAISPDSKVAGYMKRVFEASCRAKGLVDQILNFSRQKENKSGPVKIRLVVNEALKLLRATIPTTVSFDIDLNRDTGLIVADPTQIHQIIMNLCTNASHAMQAKGGTLSVSLKNVSIDTESAKYLFNLNPGEFIHLQISDTGHGIKQEILKHVFDPYFTTKEVGEGTGLGLAVVHGIIQSMAGDIQVYSEPEKGTTFNIFIPRTNTDTIGCKKIKQDYKTGTERILLVDDEEVLTEMNGEILRSLGYQVTARVSPVEAFNTFKKNPAKFDLLITDQTMPHKTGSELAAEILKIQPTLPIILCTGFSSTVDEQKAADIGIKAFLKKPVLKNRLADAVREVLTTDDTNT